MSAVWEALKAWYWMDQSRIAEASRAQLAQHYAEAIEQLENAASTKVVDEDRIAVRDERIASLTASLARLTAANQELARRLRLRSRAKKTPPTRRSR